MTTPYDDGIVEPDSGGRSRDMQLKREGYLRGVADTLASPELAALVVAAEQAREAFLLTREYVGFELLPAIEGWAWYDATFALGAALAALDAKQP